MYFETDIVIRSMPEPPPSAVDYRAAHAPDNITVSQAEACVNLLAVLIDRAQREIPAIGVVEWGAQSNSPYSIYLSAPIAREAFGNVSKVKYVAHVRVGGKDQLVDLGKVYAELLDAREEPLANLLNILQGIYGFKGADFPEHEQGRARYGRDSILLAVQGVKTAALQFAKWAQGAARSA